MFDEKFLFLCFGLIWLWACKTDSAEKKGANDTVLSIVCTTGMLTDAVREIVPEQVQVNGLMGPGVDPHLYKATQGDLKLLSNADIIIYNGLHLEGKMGEIFDRLRKQKTILIASDAISEEELIISSDFKGARDPHLWFDVALWSKVVNYLAAKLSEIEALDQQLIHSNSEKYIKELEQLDEWITTKLEPLDSNQRILITAHDAFGYFGRAYSMEVRGLQGISTLSEYGLKDVSELVDYISQNKIKSVFVESSVSDRSLNAVIEGCRSRKHNVKIGGRLFSDALGDINTPEGKYIGMVRHNINTIVEGLR